ncbi:MAG: M14 family metallopeptidase [Planctomycetaceae bacterium]
MSVELKQHHITGEKTGPNLLITGGVHGDEFEPMAAIRRLAANPPELKRGSVTLVPCVNKDAFLRGHRCASDGLDLARTCPGNTDGSLTERTASALSELICRADYYIDLHTGGTEFSIYPLAGYMLHSNTAVLEQQRVMANAFNLPIVWGTSAALEGRSLSVARDADVPAIYCEFGGSATCSTMGTEAYVEGCLNVMAALHMVDRQVSVKAVHHIIEDRHPDSGHLQVCNPSPVDGFFESAVVLGQQISAGTELGHVVALTDGSVRYIQSPHAGLVIMLRTFPRVRAGESVGVVLQM